MLACQNASSHGHYLAWAMDALCSKCIRPPGLSLVRLHQTMDVIMVGPWLDHGCSAAMDVIIAPHGCSLVHLLKTMDVIMVGPWMLWPQNASDQMPSWLSLLRTHLDSLDRQVIMARPWMLSSHRPSIAWPASKLQFLMRTSGFRCALVFDGQFLMCGSF